MKRISCFLSSTFNDMQSERDFFRSTLEDKINDNLRNAGLFLEFIDLRWGVNVQTEEESNHDKKVLRVCLNEIKNTKPFFIVFLGERYGWIPKKEDVLYISYENGGSEEDFASKSITEIEINYALSTYMDTGKCLFYFRNPVDFGDDEQARQRYVSTGEEAKKLTELKQKLAQLYPKQIRTYDAAWDKENASFVLESNFKETVFNDIESLFRDECNSRLLESSHQKQQRIIGLTIEKNAALFAGRKAEQSKAFYYLDNSAKGILDVVSEDGAGKSFFISKVAQELAIRDTHIVLPYVCDSVDEVFSLRELMEYFMQLLGCDEDFSGYTLEELIKKFQQTVNVIGLDKPIVILIDGIDRIVKEKSELAFLNSYAYNNVKFIISRNDTYSLSKYIRAMDSLALPLYNYTESDIREIAERFFALSHRTISEEFIGNIIAKERQNPKTCSTPSYLALLLQKVDNLSEKDFKIINQRVDANGLPFSENVELFQKGIIEKSAKTFEEELYQQRSNIEQMLPVAKYYFEYLAIAPHGMSEREMDFVLEQFSVKHTPTDFSLFIKAFKCFLTCDENGYWHFSQRRILNYFRCGISNERQEKYNRILLALYNKSDKAFLKHQYALACYLAVKDFQSGYDFLLSNIRNKSVLRSFAKYIDHSNAYIQEFFQIFAFDQSRELEAAISKILRGNEVQFAKWYYLLSMLYPKNSLRAIMANKEMRGRVYNNIVALSYCAYNKGEYRKGLWLVSLITKYFKGYLGTKLYHAYEVKVLDIICRAQLGKAIDYSALMGLVMDAMSTIKCKKDQAEENWASEKRKILKLLNAIDKIYRATEETKERDRFNLDITDVCLELGYLEGDEYIYWLSKKFAYWSRNSEMSIEDFNACKACSRWAFRPMESGSDGLSVDVMIQNALALLHRQMEELVAYIHNPSSNQELVAICCINLSKYHDNVVVEDNYLFTDLALSKTRENLSDNFSSQAISLYQTALTQKVDEAEMLECLQVEAAQELLRISKLGILVEPTTKNFDTYFEAYQKCAERNAISDEDRKDKDEYLLKRKQEVKFEVSESKQLARRKQLIFGTLLLLAGVVVFGVSLYFLRNVSLWTQFIIVILLTGIAGYVGGLGVNSFFETKNKNRIITGILLLSASCILAIYLLTYKINDDALRDIIIDTEMNSGMAAVYHRYLVEWGGKELLGFLMQLFLLVLPVVFSLARERKFLKEYRLWRSSSDVRNYKTYVKEYPQRKKFLTISTVVTVVGQTLITLFLVCKWFIIKDLKYVVMFELRSKLILVLVVIIAVGLAVNLFAVVALQHHLKHFEREREKYDKKRANIQG